MYKNQIAHNFSIGDHKSLYENCPICNRKLEAGRFSIVCRNKCYAEFNNYVLIFRMYIGGFYFSEELEKMINYWKKNDRYLMEIMEGKK